MKKNMQIQFIRGLLCLMVVLYHLTYRYCEIYEVDSIFINPILTGFGIFAVFGFFVLSGYYLIPDKLNDKNRKEIIFYYVKRIIPIYILYLAAITIIYLLSLSGYLGQRQVGFKDYLCNIFFIQFITGNYVDGAHWYIISIIFFYIVACIFSMFKKRGKYMWGGVYNNLYYPCFM